MRVLFSSTSGAGHFGPMVPFIRSCIREGHHVLVVAPSVLGEASVATGASFWPVGTSSSVRESATQTLPPMNQSESDGWSIGMLGQLFGRLRSTAATPWLCEAIRSWVPDVLVRESSEFGAAVAAEIHHLPHSRIGVGLGVMEEMWISLAAPAVDQLRQAYGLAADEAGDRLRAAPYLTMFPARMEVAEVPPPSQVQRFSDPRWRLATPRQESRPRVYVTFGSVTATMPQYRFVYLEVLRALEAFEGDVLMTVGRWLDPTSLNPPPNVRVERWVEQGEALDGAAAVVCHGGGGTTLGALSAGLPLVVVPLFAPDQNANAQQVVAMGAGVIAAPHRSAIRSGLHKVLEDPSYRASARRLADEMRCQISLDKVEITEFFLRG